MIANDWSEYQRPGALVASVIDPVRASVIVNYMYSIRPGPGPIPNDYMAIS